MTPARFDMVVSGGLVPAGADLVRRDIGIRNGTIVAIEQRLEDADAIVRADGRLVLPGGIDSHCHMEQPSYGADCADDFASGTLSAAFGGTTTVIPFAMATPDDPLLDVARGYRAAGEAKAYVDFGVHPTIQRVDPGSLERDLATLAGQGFAALKIFTTYEGFALADGDILRVLDAAARLGMRVMVHAENTAIIELCTRQLLARDAVAAKYHAASRPVEAEAEAIHRLAVFAGLTGAGVTIVHVTTAQGLRLIREAAAGGAKLAAETCPQYLLCTEDDLDAETAQAARFLCSPPLRSRQHQQALWRGIEDGSVDLYSSDHSPYRLDGPGGKLRHGPGARFDQIPNGMPGLELRLPLLFSEAYLTGRISLDRFISLAATRHADLNGIAHCKGALAVGMDADLALWDRERETTVSHRLLHDGVGYTPYEGKRLRGWPVTVLSRGDVVVQDGRLAASAGRGRFVAARWSVRGGDLRSEAGPA